MWILIISVFSLVRLTITFPSVECGIAPSSRRGRKKKKKVKYGRTEISGSPLRLFYKTAVVGVYTLVLISIVCSLPQG